MVAIVGEIVEPAQRKGRAEDVALAGVVEDEIEDGADARLAQRRDGLAQVGMPLGARRGSSAMKETGCSPRRSSAERPEIAARRSMP